MDTELLLMVVDDDPADLYSSERALRGTAGFDDILMTTNGVSTLEVLQERSAIGAKLPDLIFLDLRMPKMNGFEFLVEFKRRYPNTNTEVVVLSGADLEGEKDHAMSHECVVGYLVKPISVNQAEAYMAQWVERHGSPAANERAQYPKERSRRSGL